MTRDDGGPKQVRQAGTAAVARTGAGEPETDSIQVEVVPDGRLKTRLHWEWAGDRIRVRVPKRIPKREIDKHVAEIVERAKRKRARARARADGELEAMAREVNRKYLGGDLTWNSIRWVSNMRTRLGSCTTGGPTDGDIRISDRMRGWPVWVIEYVVAHELVHRKHPNHSAEFYSLLDRVPQAERAQGFLLGVAFHLGVDAGGWL